MNWKIVNIVVVILLIINLFSCKKVEVKPAPIFANVTLSAEYISHSSQDLKFKVRFLILDSRAKDGLIEDDISTGLYISPYTGDSSGAYYTYTLNSIKKVSTAILGNSSTAIMLDESEIEEDNFNNQGAEYVLSQETACRIYFKNIANGSNFILSAYGSDNQLLPYQPLTIYGDNFTNNALIYDQTLAELRRYSNFSGNTPFLLATDSLLEFMNLKAPNENKNLIAFPHSEDNVGGKDWATIINKALDYNIHCNIILTYQSSPNFYELIQLASVTGGFIFYVENNQNGRNIPFFAEHLNDILQGNILCYETEWAKHSDKPVFESNYYEGGYIELYIDNQRLYTYLPYYVGIP